MIFSVTIIIGKVSLTIMIRHDCLKRYYNHNSLSFISYTIVTFPTLTSLPKMEPVWQMPLFVTIHSSNTSGLRHTPNVMVSIICLPLPPTYKWLFQNIKVNIFLYPLHMKSLLTSYLLSFHLWSWNHPLRVHCSYPYRS